MLALVLAAGVAGPSLILGRFADDYLHMAEMRRFAPIGGPLDVYRFADGKPEHLSAFMARGPYPWWALPELRLSFFRPLSSGLSSLDDLVLGAPAWLQHLHSVLWYLALVAVVTALLRRILPGALGALGLLIFALDEGHALPVIWLANRNAIVAAAPAFLALLLHLKWREDGVRWALPASLACWAIALCGGESAIGVMAYVAAYELVGAKGTSRQRALAFAPLAALFAGYLVLYRSLGYGASGSGIYLDPASQPGQWLAVLGPRWLALAGGALVKLPAELGATTTWVHWIAWVGGAGAVVLFVAIARRFWPTLETEEQRHLRWLIAGAALSVLPLASTFPSNRLLLVPSFGASVLVAAAIRSGFAQGRRIGAGVLVALHIVLTVPAWALFMWFGAATTAFAEEAATTIEVDAQTVANQRVAVLGAPDAVIGAYIDLMRHLHGQPVPKAWWPLTLKPTDQRVTRTGPATLVLEPMTGRFGDSLFELLFRGADHPFRTGDVVVLDGMTVTIEGADDEGISRVAFTFDVPLEDPSLQLLVWRKGALRRYTPPALGVTEPLIIEGTLPILR